MWYSPNMSGKKKAPPKAEKLLDFHSDIVKETLTKHPSHPLILVGKSMGSRVGGMVASLKDNGVSAIVGLCYPLKVVSRKERERQEKNFC
ncbi:hypothetical protein RJT34_17203 [Clitoria ternatea]|uniref:KANL3/Tex30 alpha/beta hydrolase-like domain-containing protein n=1 Tax=Clitoria ternatea TaxID=43366 RepID=A0AAN9J8I5_CLITE